jgi:methoxymalonate biosynthesis acyl carrier protein
MDEQYAADIKAYLAEATGQLDLVLTEDTSLIEAGFLDSFGIVELVAFIEGKYDIKLDSDDLVVANFSLIASIVALITEKKRG